MEQMELRAHSRKLVGKKVRFLRRQGITPVHLFGHNIESLALQCDTGQLEQLLMRAGRTELVGLKLDGAKKLRSAVVREVKRDALSGGLVHVDFYQVSMEEKIKVEVPIVLVGEAPALKSKGYILSHELDSLHIECLPDRIPASVQVDTSSLAEEGQGIHVQDIVLGEGITVLDDPEHVIVKVSVLRIEKIEVVEKVAEVAEVAVEAAEGAPSPEGESKEEKRGKGERPTNR
jgi:large subunit ribosomal protein L25